MKRLAVIGLVGTASVVSFAAGAFVTADYISDRFNDRFRSREAYWTSTLDREVNVGESKPDTQAWLDRQVIWRDAGDLYDPAERMFFGTVDKFHDPIGYPCSDWDLAVEITIGKDDRVTGRKVTTSGACL